MTTATLTIVELRRTCGACPSQWEGRLDDGRYLYIRYRYGWLEMGLGTTFIEAVQDRHWSEFLGDAWGGFIEYEEMRAHLPHFVWPESEQDGRPRYDF